MLLKSITYSQFDGQPNAWRIEGLDLGETNLLVGKNAVGKSQALSIIVALARMLGGELKPSFESGNYHVTFDHDDIVIIYTFSYLNSIVTSETLQIGDTTFLERGQGGIGKIYAEKVGDGMSLLFQTPEN